MVDNANTNMITIANLTTSNGGDYTCNVTNDAGYNSNTSLFIVSSLFVP